MITFSKTPQAVLARAVQEADIAEKLVLCATIPFSFENGCHPKIYSG